MFQKSGGVDMAMTKWFKELWKEVRWVCKSHWRLWCNWWLCQAPLGTWQMWKDRPRLARWILIFIMHLLHEGSNLSQ